VKEFSTTFKAHSTHSCGNIRSCRDIWFDGHKAHPQCHLISQCMDSIYAEFVVMSRKQAQVADVILLLLNNMIYENIA